MRSVHLKVKNHLLFTAFLFICFAFLPNLQVTAQITVTVTGNTNTTPNLLASYPNLAAALTDMNAVTAMTGPVVLSCTGGTSETAPPTGLTLGSASLNAVLSATNTITINKTGAGAVTLNAGVGTATPASAAPDGIFKLSGADYVTIDGLTFTDGNTANPATMEFGLALFKRAAGDGCNNNTIQNCTFNMQRINNASSTSPMIEGAVGILVINSTATAATTSLTPTNGGTLATNGTNSGNKFYGNAINGGNYGIGLSGFAASTGVGPTPTATTFLGDLGNDIGSVAGNTILNYGGGAATNPAAGIRANNQWSLVITGNTVNNNNGSGVNHATTLRGIYAQAGTSANITISDNIVTVKSAATSSAATAIENVIGSTAASNTVTIFRNTIENCTYTTATTATFTGILTAASATNVNINNNTINNNNLGAIGTASSCTFQGIYNSATSTNFTANNNTITNNTILNQGGTLYCLRGSTSLLTWNNNTINNNGFPNHGGSLAASLYGLYDLSSPTQENFANNLIDNLTITGSSTSTSSVITGIHLNTSSSSNKNLTGNVIHTFSFVNSSTGSCTINGISNSLGLIANINKNKIYNLISNGASSAVNGIIITSGTTVNVYNNLIGDLRTPAANAANPLIGLSITGGTTVNAYYNTVYLNGSSTGALFGSSAVSVSSTPTVTLRNNIFVNTSTVNGAAFAAAHRRSTTTLTSYAAASNNNLFYAGTPSATNVIYYDGTNNDQTLSAYKTRVAARDAASVTENVSWQSTTGSNANFLKYNTGLASQIESGAVNIATYTDDFNGTIRQGNMGYTGTGAAPDMGAWELEGILADFTGPSITYTTLGNTSCNTDRTISGVTITDASMVNISGGTRPRLYYKKATNANTYVDNTNATDGWKYVEATGMGGSPFSFTTDFTLLSGGAPITGDVIQYFIVAQDQAGTPNVGINSGIFAATPTSVALTAAAFPLTGSINSYNQVVAGLSGTKTVGAMGDYTGITTATGLFNAINTSGLSGNLVVNLLDASISETGATALNAVNYNGCAAGPYSITIKPNTATTTVLTGSVSSGALIKLNGADNVTIDGSNSGGTDKSLTITNTATTAPCVIWLTSLGTGLGAESNTIKNCILNASAATTNTAYGISVSGSTIGSAGADNDNTTILNNTINSFNIGVYANGSTSTSAGGLDNLLVSSNTFTSNSTTGDVYGVKLGNSLTTSVTANSFNLTTSAATAPVAISLETGVSASSITTNKITQVNATNTGGYGGRGITIGTGTASSNITVSNNFIAGVNGSNWNAFGNSSSMGIAIGIIGNSSTLTTTAGGINLYHNSINMTGSMGTGSTTALTAALYVGSGASALNIKNNIFVNTQVATSTTQKNYGIYSAAANTAFTDLNNNDYFVTNTFNAGSAVLGFLTSDRTTIAAWRTASGQDLLSFSEVPTFISDTDLHLNMGLISTQLESGGATTAVLSDIDGNVRPGPAGSVNGGASAPDLGADEFDGVPAVAMSYTSSTTDQISGAAYAGAANQAILRIKVVTTGTLSPVSATSFTLNANGTTNIADINAATAKVYYTGASTTFSTGTLFGATTPTIANYTVSGTQALLTGDNYFWVAYDVTPGAMNNNVIDGECISVTVGSAQTPTVTAPTGNKVILGPMSGTYLIGSAQTSPNFTTITSAVNDLNGRGVSGAVTFRLLDPNYSTNETFPIVINAITGASASNTITILPSTGVTALVTGSADATSGALFKLNGADYVTFDGSNSGGTDRSLTIRNTSSAASGNAVIWLASPASGNGATNNTIKNCIIEGNSATTTFTGVHIGGSTTVGLTTAGTELNSNNTIDNNLFRKSQYGATLFGFAAASPDLNNIISNNNFGTAVSGEGFSLLAINADRQQNLIVSGNEVQNVVNATNTSSTPFGGIRLLDFKNGLCYNNKVHDLAYTGTSTPKIYGIAVTSSSYTTVGNPSNASVYNNMVYKITSTGVSAVWNTTGILASAGYGDKFYYNTVHLAGQLANSSTGLAAAFANGDGNITTVCTNIDVRNNIFSLTGSSAVAGGNFWAYYTAATSLAGSTLNNNDLYCAGTNATNNIGRFNSVNYTTLAAWQGATGQDANSVSIAPIFVSASDMHLEPGSNSSLNNLGTPVAGVTTDIDGNTRDVTNPDMGADEFTPLVCVTAEGGMAFGSTSLCATGTPTITASGYSTGMGSTYQWYSSTNFADYPNGGTMVSGQTTPASLTTGVVTTTTYFWLRVTCGTDMSTDNSTLVTITVNPKPVVSAANDGPKCVGSTLTLSGTHDIGTTFNWTGPNSFTSTSQNPTISNVTLAASGTYNFTATSAVGCTSNVTTTVVAINPVPTSVSVSPVNTVLCPTSPAQLLTSSGGSITSFNSFTTNTISLAIPDNSSTGVSSTLAVSGIPAGATIDSIIATFSITHSFDEDVLINLEAPNGQIINLVKGNIITTGTNFTNTRISSDETKPAIPTSGSPFTSTYKADKATTGFQLTPSPVPTTATWSSLYTTLNGDWKLRVYDDESIGTGTLTNFQIKLAYSAPVPPVWSPTTGLYTDAGAMSPYTGTNTTMVFAKPTSTQTYTATASTAATFTYNGNITETGWGAALATSAGGPTPGFGAGHEVNAIYVQASDTHINLGLAGNVQDGNRILVFIDSKSGGYNDGNFGRTSAPQGVDDFNSATTFDGGFNADYCLVIGTNAAGDNNFFDLFTLSGTAGMGGGPSTYLGDRFTSFSGAFTGANPANSNNTQGFEVGIPKSLLGYTSGGVKVFAMYTSDGGFLSNQFLTKAGAMDGNYGGGAVVFGAAMPDPVTVPSANLNNYCTSTGTATVQVEGTVVKTTADAGFNSLRSVYNCISEGGTITYDQPTTVTTVLTAPLNITKSVTIQGLSNVARPEITIPAGGMNISDMKTLTLENVDVKSTATDTFTGTGTVEIKMNATTVIKQ